MPVSASLVHAPSADMVRCCLKGQLAAGP